MSLNDVQLPPVIIRELFKNSLIDLDTGKTAAKTAPTPAFSFLGDNKKRVAVIVSEAAVLYLPDDDLNFLTGILKACDLNMADIALLNLAANPSLDHTLINQELLAEKMLLFGVTPLELKMPLQFPLYQIQSYNKQVFLSSPALSLLQKDKAEKMKLWNCLKKIFLAG